MQNLNQKTVNNLIKGLITEAGELTFPEGASVDELNCSLSRDGSRSRRLGLQFETGATTSSFTVDEAEAFSVGQWDNPGGIAGLTFMVLQVGSTLYFYNAGQAPYSGQNTGLSVDLLAHQISGGDASMVRVEVATIASSLVVASEAIDTIYLTYDGANISVTEIEFRIRDFEWLSDVCDLTDQIPTASVTDARRYDTFNAGWVGNNGSTLATVGGATLPSGLGLSALSTYLGSRTAWPPLTHPWFSGKDSGGNFSLAEWENVFSGSSLIGNGRFVIDFFNKDRNTVAGMTGIPTEVETTRFSSVASYAGRMFFAGLGSGANSGKILYSRIVETVKASDSCTLLGECFQQNDPTSEYFSDLLETDGGVIHIPEAYNIKKLYTHNQYLYVFADNGVWVISGPDSRFTATSYYVSKVSNVGIYNSGSFVAAEGVPFWWSKYGIHTFAYDESSGFPIEQNLSIATVQTFWNEIDTNAKNLVTAAYDRVNKQIFWLYPRNDETVLTKKNRILILDVQLQAFYPWDIADAVDYPMGLFFFDAYGAEEFEDVVFDNSLTTVTTGAGNVFTTGYNLIRNSQTQLGVLTYNGGNLTVSSFSSKSFVDWGTENYDAYVECGYDFGGDLLLKKSAPYVTVLCRSTEEGYTPAPNFNVINPSGLFLEAYWDFRDYPATRQQVYRIKPSPVLDTTNLSDNGQTKSVVTSRLKVRGSGRSMRMRFVAEEGKNFVLLGYSVLVGANARF
jgi:hypothetical protein